MTIIEATKIKKISDELKDFAARMDFLLKYTPKDRRGTDKLVKMAKDLDELLAAPGRFNKIAIRPVEQGVKNEE